MFPLQSAMDGLCGQGLAIDVISLKTNKYSKRSERKEEYYLDIFGIEKN
jgi:hypothetical protein